MKKALVLLLCCLPSVLWAANDLKNHPSPYLAMHGDDPVQWRQWGEPAIQEARDTGRLLYVSIGYFSCHWCHVMHRESYTNPQIAEYLNTHFIPIKVDRELRPALDEVLIDFVEKTQGHAGWPLNVFLIPEGYPLYGFTYQPAESFKNIMDGLNNRWIKERAELTKIAKAASDQLAELNKGKKTALRYETNKQIKELANAFVGQALGAADMVAGGFGNQNKFPSVPQLMALTELNDLNTQGEVRGMVEYALFMMASQGLRDQLAGGFFRYTVDPNWQVPHFEKMLYDNAQLAELYIRAGQLFERDALTGVGFNTLDFVVNEMSAPKGGYIASLSAVDHDGIEGGNYVWDKKKLKSLVTKQEYKLLRMLWRLDEPAQVETGYLPVQAQELPEIAKELKIDVPSLTALFESARSKLLKQRETRPAPRDDKVLAAWNGLLLSAFSKAAGQAGGERFAAKAEGLKNYLRDSLWDGETLVRARDEAGNPIGKAGLEDYAYVARGMADYALFSGKEADTNFAKDLITQAWMRFYTDAGWQQTEKPLLPIGVQEPSLADGPMYSPSAALIEASLNIGVMDEKARDVLANAHPDMEEAPFFHATQVRLLSHRVNTSLEGG